MDQDYDQSDELERDIIETTRSRHHRIPQEPDDRTNEDDDDPRSKEREILRRGSRRNSRVHPKTPPGRKSKKARRRTRKRLNHEPNNIGTIESERDEIPAPIVKTKPLKANQLM